MPALDIFRALIHPGSRWQTQPGKKLRKQSILRSKKDDSVASSSTEHGHAQRGVPPQNARSIPREHHTYQQQDNVPRNPPTLQHYGESTYSKQQQPPSHYSNGPNFYQPHYAPQVYPQETEYYEYEVPEHSPTGPHGHYPSMHGGAADYSGSWNLQPSTYDISSHHDTSGYYDASGYSFVTDSIHPQYYIEPSEKEDYSPIPDVHRQSTSSEDRSLYGNITRHPSGGNEDESLHGTFGLGTRPSSRRMDSVVSDGRWTTAAEYEQSVAYELYEVDPDASRPASSYYPQQARSVPMSSTPPPTGRTPRSHSPHQDAEQRRDESPPPRMLPPGSGGLHEGNRNPDPRQLPALSIPQPHYPPAPHPSLHEEQGTHFRPTPSHQPARKASVTDEHGRRELPRRQSSFKTDAHQAQSRAGHPDPSPEQRKRARDHSATRRHEDTLPAPGRGPTLPLPPPRPFSPEDISPEILERDYGSDDEVYQYVVPTGVDVIFRDATGNEITRVGKFPLEPPPPPPGKQAQSAPMVVVDERGREIYRNFAEPRYKRGFKYDGHILHDER